MEPSKDILNQIKTLQEKLSKVEREYEEIKDNPSIDRKIINETLKKRKNLRTKITCLKKYGVDNPSKSKKVKNKMREVFIEKYGVENPFQAEEIKEKIRNTNLERYGVENPFQAEEIKEKIKETLKRNYGVEHPANSPEIVAKIQDTLMERYGVTHPMHSQEITESMKETVKERYGTDYYVQSEDFKKKSRRTFRKRFGVDHPMKNPEFEKEWTEKFQDKYGVKRPLQIKEIMERMERNNLGKKGYRYTLESPKYQKSIVRARLSHIENFDDYYNFKSFVRSLEEPPTVKFLSEHFGLTIKQIKAKLNVTKMTKEVADYEEHTQYSEHELAVKEILKELRINHTSHDRETIKPLELDFLLEDIGVALEVSPGFTHSSNSNIWRTDIDRNYHLNKFLQCKKKGIQLVTLFDWNDYRTTIESLLREDKSKSPTGPFSTDNSLGVITLEDAVEVASVRPSKVIYRGYDVYDCGRTLWIPKDLIKNKEALC